MSLAVASSAACSRCSTPLEGGDLRCTICSLPTPFDAGARRLATAEVLRCRGCGASVEYDVNVRAPKCAFCGSVVALERVEDPLEQAELYLPFRTDPNTARASLQGWLSSRGFFRPSDLATQSTVEALVPIWWVGWTFDTEALVSWTADSNAGAGRSAWAPHAGQSPLSLRSVLVSASRGLSLAETAALASRFDLNSAQSAPHAMPGVVIERFDVQRSMARTIVAQAVENAAASYARAWIPGSTYRKLHVAVLLKRLVTRRLAFPSYVLAYRYGGKLFRVVVHGQDPRCVIGDSPISIWKVILVIALVLLGIAVLLAIAAAAIAIAGTY